MLEPYRTLWSTPAVPTALTAVFVSALPIGMAGLAIILSVQQWTGSLPLAGLLAGVFSAGNAAGLLLQGRVLGSWNPALVIMVTGLVSAVGFALLIMTGYAGATPMIMVVLVAICGVTIPAITTAVRAWLPLVVSDEPAGPPAMPCSPCCSRAPSWSVRCWSAWRWRSRCRPPASA